MTDAKIMQGPTYKVRLLSIQFLTPNQHYEFDTEAEAWGFRSVLEAYFSGTLNQVVSVEMTVVPSEPIAQA